MCQIDSVRVRKVSGADREDEPIIDSTDLVWAHLRQARPQRCRAVAEPAHRPYLKHKVAHQFVLEVLRRNEAGANKYNRNEASALMSR